jgi:hypothetical protein
MTCAEGRAARKRVIRLPKISLTKGLNKIMKKAILIAIVGAMTLGVNAGDWGKAPVDKTPIEECYDIGGEISSGYMTDYIFYGVRFATDSVWTDVNYTFDNFVVPITIGAWYQNGTNMNTGLGTLAQDELDLYLSAAIGTYFGFDTSLSYTHYFFPEAGASSYGEIGLDVTRSLGFVDFIAEANYALTGNSVDDGGSWYYQAGLEKTFGITDAISLVLGAGVGYSDNYFSDPKTALLLVPGHDSGFNHYYVTASLPIALNCRATLTPYITYTGAPDGWVADGVVAPIGLIEGAQSDILSGGVSLSVSF